MTDESQNARQRSRAASRHWLLRVVPLTAILSGGMAVWRFVDAQHPSDVVQGVISAFLAVVLILFYRELRLGAEARAELGKLAKDLLADIFRPHQTHLSIHHLFNDRDLLRPRGGGNVDMILDAADLPPALMDYLKDVHAAGAKTRILLLDPASSLTERHRFVQQAGSDASTAAQHFRAKINAAIEELQPLSTIRLFDAVPPGNLIIVDDHIFWGGVPSIPSDAAYPIVGVTADTREQVYWAFRRNFDVLWKQAKPVAPAKPAANHLTAASL